MIQSGEFDLYSFIGDAYVTDDKVQEISAEFRRIYFQKFQLPYFFNLGRCMMSDLFVSCEMDVPFKPEEATLGVKNKLLMSVTYEKTIPKKEEGWKALSEKALDPEYKGQFSTRMAVVPFTKLCSNSNTYFLRSDTSQDVDMLFQSNPELESFENANIKSMKLAGSLNMVMNFTDYN